MTKLMDYEMKLTTQEKSKENTMGLAKPVCGSFVGSSRTELFPRTGVSTSPYVQGGLGSIVVW